MIRLLYSLLAALLLACALLLGVVHGTGHGLGLKESLRHMATGTLITAVGGHHPPEQMPRVDRRTMRTVITLAESADIERRVLIRLSVTYPELTPLPVEIQTVWLPGSNLIQVSAISSDARHSLVYANELLNELMDVLKEIIPPTLLSTFEPLWEHAALCKEKLDRLTLELAQLKEKERTGGTAPDTKRLEELQEDIDRVSKDHRHWQTMHSRYDAADPITTINVAISERPKKPVEVAEGWNPLTLALRHPRTALVCALVAGVVVMLVPLHNKRTSP